MEHLEIQNLSWMENRAVFNGLGRRNIFLPSGRRVSEMAKWGL